MKPFSDFQRVQVLVDHIHTGRQNVHTHTLKLNNSKRMIIFLNELKAQEQNTQLTIHVVSQLKTKVPAIAMKQTWGCFRK